MAIETNFQTSNPWTNGMMQAKESQSQFYILFDFVSGEIL